MAVLLVLAVALLQYGYINIERKIQMNWMSLLLK